MWFDNDGGGFYRAPVFTGAATDTEIGDNVRSNFIRRFYGVPGALFLAKQAEFPLGPTQAARMVDFGQPHHDLFNRQVTDSAGRTYLLTMLRQFAASFAGYDIGGEK